MPNEPSEKQIDELESELKKIVAGFENEYKPYLESMDKFVNRVIDSETVFLMFWRLSKFAPVWRS